MLMTLQQLAEAAALAMAGVDQSSGRVREVPDVRTIRYYTTLGLIDRATEMRGRTAYYSDKHVQQLVAIKRLQAEGLSLEQIQTKLLGAPAVPVQPPKARADFWKARPVTMQTVQLAPGVLLTLDVSVSDQQALLEAAQGLLRFLESHKKKELP